MKKDRNSISMKKIISITVLFLMLILPIGLFARNYGVKASIDSVAMFIGDQATLSFNVSSNSSDKIGLPLLDKNVLGKLEIVDALKIDTIVADGIVSFIYKYKITSFDSTLALIPSLPFAIGLDTQYSNPVSIKIVDVPVDTTQMAITDIKPIENPTFDFYLLYTIIAIIVIVVGLVFLFYKLFKAFKRKPLQEELKPIDTRTPFEIAESSLLELKDKKLYQQGKIKEYFTELTDILRVFFYNKYEINALESTSDELVTELQNINIIKNNSEYLLLIKGLLSQSDFVKFAKYIPEMRECEKAFDKVTKVICLDREITADEQQNINQNGDIK